MTKLVYSRGRGHQGNRQLKKASPLVLSAHGSMCDANRVTNSPRSRVLVHFEILTPCAQPRDVADLGHEEKE
jgi:hypothetical protein